MATLIWVSLFAVGVIVWLRHNTIKARAFQLANQYCREQEVQLLDGTIILTKLYFARINNNQWQLVQQFQFEFTSTGERRYFGWVALAGQRLVNIELQPHIF